MGVNNHSFRSCDEWISIIQECRTSGLSDSAWCRKNGIAVSSFYSAINRCRTNEYFIPERSGNVCTQSQEVVPVSFVGSYADVTTAPVTQGLQKLYSDSVIQVLINDYKVNISNNCAGETIRNTLLALKEIC